MECLVLVGVGGAMGDAAKLSLTAWERDFRINATSMVLMSRYVIPEMRKNGQGAIANMSSVSERKCCPHTLFSPQWQFANAWLFSPGR